MKIEKVNDNQIKFILSQSDLEARDIRLTELAYGTEKTQTLFREMMQQASAECGFEADNVPLMIEAIPFSADGITIIVTKVGSADNVENHFNILPQSMSKQKESVKQKAEPKARRSKSENVSIFSFDNLDQVTDASIRLYRQFNGTNVLYKNHNRYFLLVQNDAPQDSLSLDDLDAVLSEYGQKHVSTAISKHYLVEHGEIIIKDTAIEMMAKHLK